MASGVNFSKLVGLAKKGLGHSEAAREMGLTVGQISSLTFQQALVEAGKLAKAPATPASIKKLRDNENNRWEAIAARTGLSVGEVKSRYVEAGGKIDTSFVGRGRPAGSSANGGKSKTKSASKKASAAKTTSKTKTKTAGRKAKSSSAKTGTRRARTLAERRAVRAANPS